MPALTDARRELGLTQQQMADELGLSLRAYQEQEALQEPRRAYILAAEALVYLRGAATVRRPVRPPSTSALTAVASPRQGDRRNELQDLVEVPNESLSVEYKSRLDLTDDRDRAQLARHIAALANYGGGCIVFGFNDDLSVADSATVGLGEVNRDIVAGIVRRYLDPAFQCDVRNLSHPGGTSHSIIIVPPHGATPICAKAGGPEVNQRPVGITRGTYYLRKPGPASEPVSSPADWQAIIRRCALHDRASLINAISALGASPPIADTPAPLLQWHEAAGAEFLRRIEPLPNRERLKRARFQLSYEILTDAERLRSRSLEQVVSEVNNEVRDLIQTGWSMFYPFSRDAIAPEWRSDAQSGEGDEDFLQCSLADVETTTPGADFWRISTSGKATLIRDYWEDEERGGRGSAPETVLDPDLVARSLAELVRHARGFAARFDSAREVAFRCEWWGLEGRNAGDALGRGRPSGRVSRTDHRVSSGAWSVGELSSDWHEIVSALGAPVSRTFGVEDRMDPGVIARSVERWGRL